MGADSDAGPLATADGRALATELVEMLESELVRFTHRVLHDHGIQLDRARASMALLGTLVTSGVPWTAHHDSSPQTIHDAFAVLATRNPATWPLGPVIRNEVARFLEATATVTAVDDVDAATPAARLRHAGAHPDLWWWASPFDTFVRCWNECGANVTKLVSVALAFDVPSDRVARALASAFTLVATRAKTRRTIQRNDLVAMLTRLSSVGAQALADRELVAKVTKLAFEMAATQQRWPGERTPAMSIAPDGLTDIAVRAFQLVELFTAIDRAPDVERYADLAAGAERTFTSLGLRLPAMLRKDLEAVLAEM
ncbi:MAG TPA: hypothetical protein VGO00_07415 [Kofleriaceae bacterium]|nr:hypothetical protein [Kofleriaceae bacterium]